MDIGEVVKRLSAEMGVDLQAGDVVPLEANAQGVKVYSGDEFYGAIALITDEKGEIQSCSYFGKYPGQIGVEVPGVFGIREYVRLDLDRRVIPFLTSRAPKLVRTDRNDVPFLGSRYDDWDKHKRDYRLSKAAAYADKLLKETNINCSGK